MIPGIGFYSVSGVALSKIQVWGRGDMTASEARQHARELIEAARELEAINKDAEQQALLWNAHEVEHDRRRRRNSIGAVA